MPKVTFDIKVAPRVTDMLGPDVSMPELQSRSVCVCLWREKERGGGGGREREL